MAYIPYGYRIVNGRAVIDEEMQKQVTMLYECFAAGATYKQSQETSGVKRTPKGCRHILQDATYLGDDFYPPLLERELFDMAQAERIRRGPGRGGRKRRGEMPVFTQFCLDAVYPEGAESLAGGPAYKGKPPADSYLMETSAKASLYALSARLFLSQADRDNSADVISPGDDMMFPDEAGSANPFAKAVSFYERIIPVGVAAAGKAD